MNDRDYEAHYEEMHGMGNTGGFLAGLLIGALAGAAIMLLTAPQTGEETRKQIRD